MKKKIYDISPIWMQNIACTIKGDMEKKNRLGGEDLSVLESLKKSEWYNEDKIQEFRNKMKTKKAKEIVSLRKQLVTFDI